MPPVSILVRLKETLIRVPNRGACAYFVASSNALLHANGVPVFSDLDLETYMLDPEPLGKAITAKTKAVIPVHLHGYPADMDPINVIAEKQGLIPVVGWSISFVPG